MAHLDDVELVGVERFVGEHVKAELGAADGSAVRHPAGCTTDEESHERRGRRQAFHDRPLARSLLETWSSLSRSGTGFFGNGAVARADALGLRPPGRDQCGLFRMSGKPGGDGLHAVGRQFAVDIGVQFILGHG